MAKHDWRTIKAGYVEGVIDHGVLRYPTLRELAVEFGCSVSSVRKRAADEEWTTQRDIYAAKVEQKRQERKSEVLAAEATVFDTMVLKTAKVAIQHIQAHFGIAQVDWEQKRTPMAAELLDKLSRALEHFQRAGRLALGEQTERTGNDQFINITGLSEDELDARLTEMLDALRKAGTTRPPARKGAKAPAGDATARVGPGAQETQRPAV